MSESLAQLMSLLGRGSRNTDVPDYSNFETGNAGPTGGTYGPTLPTASPLVGGAASGLGSGLGMNIGTGQLALGGASALASLWSGMQAAGLAKKQFDLTKRSTETNLANQLQSYNTALTDRSRVRGVMEGQSQAQVDDYNNRNRLVAR